jgi:hypothetical protein
LGAHHHRQAPDRVVPVLKHYSRDRMGKGVKSVAMWTNPESGVENVVAGAGNGDVVMINPDMKIVHSHRTNVMGGVTSLALSPDCAGMMVGTDQCNRYYLDCATWAVSFVFVD